MGQASFLKPTRGSDMSIQTNLTPIDYDLMMEYLAYDRETGVFTWKKSPSSKISVGAIAGGKDSKGYIRINLKRRRYGAHRLAIYYETKVWHGCLDHINGIPGDNRICNLRPCTVSQNKYNQKIYKNNKCGFKGVRKATNGNKWSSQISVDKEQIHLGTFDSPEEAHKAYKQAAIELHGEFAKFK